MFIQFVLQLLSKNVMWIYILLIQNSADCVCIGRAINPEKVASSVEEIIALLRQFEKKMFERKRALQIVCGKIRQ